MNAASKPTGLQVGSTRPLSRAERRAQAARVTADDTTTGDETPTESQPRNAEIPAAPVVVSPSPGGEEKAQPAGPVQLKTRQRKSPFATQLHAGTLARLEWIKAHGYVITDTVDEAINRYLDDAGIPKPDRNDRMP
ncbi:hypothetical protein PP568_25265 [Mycobacteroides abscessus]|jgi:hypothetical protein|uniref:Uncharacterized protein n=1 Tax=Mycobacteroides abscessus subsp. abscessus TaxID=1185650 RepID=A0AB38D8A7_9MYCO|nr:MULTISPECIES: hypothetical protein [Mycobacteriaceae]MDY6996621.1 hypothetical protein [Actinomycetota bacterium]KKC03504.1 hypothetical protein WU83_18675 [Mycobacterium nebraskense]MBN7297560.1 hypothetical protein [Mycobacteroides abscessus subsp. abscessus]MBN7459446.1 hypothetical protein [Mycobacteroides abscessus subsp. abscessus]MBN7557565.1 hypothetical protein [Mycobacteroides abscessus subsp. abscessus]